MFSPIKPDKRWSDVGLLALITSIIMMVLLSLLDGVMKGPVAYSVRGVPTVAMLSTWVTDFRFFFEQGIYAATVFFVGAKFFETRTILTIGFDKFDAGNVVLNGPDDNNVVWIGHRYGTRMEADAIAGALAERLKESTAA